MRRLRFPTREVSGLAFLIGLLLASFGAQAEQEPVLLATTTSVADSGLLDALLAELRATSPDYAVKPLVVGSGQSLALAARGEVDVLITHDPPNEDAFLAAHPNAARWPLMSGRFVIAGPADDPAKVAQAKDIPDAFARIAKAQAPFISRADKSGTYSAELGIWRKLGLTPGKPWYIEAGGGMAAALRLADERHAYVLTDLATLLNLGGKVAVKNLLPEVSLPNPYSIVLVDAKSRPDTARLKAAWAFARFLSGSRSSALIADFGRKTHGQAFFVLPDSSSPKP